MKILLLALLLFAAQVQAAISFIADDTAHSASATTLTGTEPVGTAQNDLVIAFACINVTGGTWTDPADFVQITQGDSFVYNCYLGYKIRAATAGSGYQFSSSSAATQMVVSLVTFRGVDTTTPLDVTFSAASHRVGYNGSITGAAAAITTVTANAWAVLCQHFNGAITGITLGPPAGYSSRSAVLQPSRTNFIVSQALGAAGTETPGVYTSTGGTTQESTDYTLALKPATAAEAHRRRHLLRHTQ